MKQKISKISFFIFLIMMDVYSSYRYIFKYGHMDNDDYSAIPLELKIGKYIIISAFIIFLLSVNIFSFKIKNLPIIFYFFFSLFVNILYWQIYNNDLINNELVISELESCFIFFSLYPLVWIEDSMAYFKNILPKYFLFSAIFSITTNIIVVYNFLFFDIIPLNSYRGALIRFGGFWNDANAFAIHNVFLIAFFLMKKTNRVLILFLIFNILFSFSFTGYILFIIIIIYFSINQRLFKAKSWILLFSAITILSSIIYYNLDNLFTIYEMKKGSIEEHSNFSTEVSLILSRPLQFHESWIFRINLNYFPFSIIVSAVMSYFFFLFFLFKKKNIFRLYYIILYITIYFLPFFEIFPVNFIFIFLLILEIKNHKIYEDYN